MYEIFGGNIKSEVKSITIRCYCSEYAERLICILFLSLSFAGSKEALETESGHLTEEMYHQVVGRKMAPNFLINRTEVYKLFEAYEVWIILPYFTMILS